MTQPTEKDQPRDVTFDSRCHGCGCEYDSYYGHACVGGKVIQPAKPTPPSDTALRCAVEVDQYVRRGDYYLMGEKPAQHFERRIKETAQIIQRHIEGVEKERDNLSQLNRDACEFDDELIGLLGIGQRTDQYDAGDGERIKEATSRLIADRDRLAKRVEELEGQYLERDTELLKHIAQLRGLLELASKHLQCSFHAQANRISSCNCSPCVLVRRCDALLSKLQSAGVGG